MSVFRLLDWWDVQVGGSDEEFDSGSLCIGNVDNAQPSGDKIVVCSLQGVVRIYNPTHPVFRVEDLVLEERLGEPILQILLGRFIPASNLLALAILHPTKLLVCEVLGNGGKGSSKSNSFYALHKVYTHELGIEGRHFSAFNMTCGMFGGALDRDMIIVQSLDGKLQIFEQTAVAFIRQFTDCLVPGPLAYLPRLDAFVTVNHATQAMCYRYQVIASAQTDLGCKKTIDRQDRDAPVEKNPGAGNVELAGVFGLTAVRSAMMEWDALLGEHCLQIFEGYFSSSTAPQSYRADDKNCSPCGEMVVVCDRSLFLVKESGAVMMQRQLERSPACACAFCPNGAPYHQLLLASHDGTLQVYSPGLQLLWAAKVDQRLPVQLGVGDFGGKRGLIALLDDSGRLSLSYLGTKPALLSAAAVVVTPAGTRDLDYNRVEEEHRALLHTIRKSQTERRSESKDKLLIRIQISRSIDFESLPSELDPPPGLVMLPNSGLLLKVGIRVFLSYSGDAQALSDVSLSVQAPPFVHVLPQNVLLKSISGGRSTPTMVNLLFFASPDHMPSTLDAELVASYLTTTDEPRVASHKFTLPLCLACRLRNASKSAAFKLTLDTDLSATPLTELFGDMMVAAVDTGMNVSDILGSTAAQAMGFQLWASSSLEQPQPAHVSILVSKTAGRYRVQSDSLSALYCISSELERRIRERFRTGIVSAGKQSPHDVLVTCSDIFPFVEYFSAVHSHFATRLELVSLYSQLNDTAHLFRLIQKRLLARFKDKNPVPLSGADVLMRETYARLLQISDTAELKQRQLARRSQELACQSRLLIQMTALRLRMCTVARALLESYLCVEYLESTGGNDDTSATGWEETVDAAMKHLLKTALAKQPKDVGQLSAPLDMPLDIESLKKHIAVVFDRLDKGAVIPSFPGNFVSPSSSTET